MIEVKTVNKKNRFINPVRKNPPDRNPEGASEQAAHWG